jgi:cell pole-organizing protein PopZ
MEQQAEEAPLITDTVRDTMKQNLAALTMLAEPPARPQIVRSGETSLEGMVRAMLRPMLAEWLDANLPAMVESLVQAEIARIVGKRR